MAKFANHFWRESAESHVFSSIIPPAPKQTAGGGFVLSRNVSGASVTSHDSLNGSEGSGQWSYTASTGRRQNHHTQGSSADFCSTAGFDAIRRRLKEGKQMGKDLEDFLEKRGKIEKEYAESLLRLVKVASGKDEIGTLRTSWEQLKAETENVARQHQTLSSHLHEEAHALKDFYLQQKEQRSKSEEIVKKAASTKKNNFDRNVKSRAAYEAKCREADKNEENYGRMQSNPAAKPKELQSTQKRMETSRATANNSDISYQEAVKNLEESRQLWEREMELLCRLSQDLEEKRIAYLRHVMWSYCNFCSQTTVDEDDSYESIRKSLEQCNVDSDIDQFVQERATGSERPASIPYFNFYHLSMSIPPPVSVSHGGPDVSQWQLPPLPRATEQDNKQQQLTASLPDVPIGADPLYATPILPGPKARSSSTTSITCPTAVTTATTQLLPVHQHRESICRVVVLYHYKAQGIEELALREGEVVEVLDREDDLWWYGRAKDGRTGMFPLTYVEKEDSEDT